MICKVGNFIAKELATIPCQQALASCQVLTLSLTQILNGALVASTCLSYQPIHLTTYLTFFLNSKGCPGETQHQFTVGTIGFHQQLSCNRLAKDGSLGQHESAPMNVPFGWTSH